VSFAPAHWFSSSSADPLTLLPSGLGAGYHGRERSMSATACFRASRCIANNLVTSQASIQILDLPGIIEGAKDGKGRGRQVIAGKSHSPALSAFSFSSHEKLKVLAIPRTLFLSGEIVQSSIFGSRCAEAP
jgi:hypothetical protein